MSWKLVYTKQAQKDAERLAGAGLKPKAQAPLAILEQDPCQTPPPVEKLVGDLAGAYSRRISIQHRLVYQTLDDARTVKVLRMWTHYGRSGSDLRQERIEERGRAHSPASVPGGVAIPPEEGPGRRGRTELRPGDHQAPPFGADVGGPGRTALNGRYRAATDF